MTNVQLKKIVTETSAQVASKLEPVTAKYKAAKLRLRGRIENKLSDIAVSVMKWMLGDPRVQRVIAKQLENNAGALCRMLDEAIENKVDEFRPELDDIEVDAGNVSGLNEMVEAIVEEMDISVKAENIEDLEEEVNRQVQDTLEGLTEELTEKVTAAVLSELRSRLA